MMTLKKYDVVLVCLDPTQGSEQAGTRPCMVIQNNPANAACSTTMICPFSSKIKKYPHTLIVEASKSNGLSHKSELNLLQIRVIDQARIVRTMGVLETRYRQEFKEKLVIGFDLDDIF